MLNRVLFAGSGRKYGVVIDVGFAGENNFLVAQPEGPPLPTLVSKKPFPRTSGSLEATMLWTKQFLERQR
jgi:hypothetical protein